MEKMLIPTNCFNSTFFFKEEDIPLKSTCALYLE